MAACVVCTLLLLYALRPDLVLTPVGTVAGDDSVSVHCGVVALRHSEGSRADSYVVRLGREQTLALISVGGGAGERPLWQIGDVVQVQTMLRPPIDDNYPGAKAYRRWYESQGIMLQGYCRPEQCRRLGVLPTLPLRYRLLRLREALVEQYAQYLPSWGEEVPVIRALTLGDRAGLSQQTRAQFAASGASHVLALSGMHLGLIYLFLRLLLLRPLSHLGHRRWRQVCRVGLLALLWLFVFLTGLPLSLLRAMTMLTIFELSGAMAWHIPPIERLALAATAIMVINPAALFDVGFQLSCLCVVGIILGTACLPMPERAREYGHDCYTPRQRRVRRFWHYIGHVTLEFVVVGVLAQIAVLPLVAYYFGAVTLYGFLLNIIVIPIVSLILGVALLFALVVPLRSLLAWPLAGLAWSLITLLSWTARLPYMSVSWQPSLFVVVLYYATLWALWHWWRLRDVPHLSRRLPWGVVAMLCCAVGVGLQAYASRPHQQDGRLYVCRVQRRAVVYAVASPEEGLLVGAGREAWQAQHDDFTHQCCDRYGLSQPVYCPLDSAVRLPHSGYASGLLVFDGRRVAIADRATTRWSMRRAVLRCPVQVDALVVTRSCRVSLAELLLRYAPQRIVLDDALPKEQERAIVSEAQRREIAVSRLSDGRVEIL